MVKSEESRPPLKWPIMVGSTFFTFSKKALELRYLHNKVEPKMPSLCPVVDRKKFFFEIWI